MSGFRIPPKSERSKARWRPQSGALKIATFNINNIRKRLPNLLEWLASSKPDIVCLQELKTAHRDFPLGQIQEARYHAVWKGERTWNGVAILSKSAEPIVTRDSLPGIRLTSRAGTSKRRSRHLGRLSICAQWKSAAAAEI